MAAPGRSYNADNYRYGFNGKEKDKDIAAGDLDFGARIYDGRIGRWLSVDPLQDKYPDLTPYNFVANSPLCAIDPDGKLIIFIGGLRLWVGRGDQRGYENKNARQGIYSSTDPTGEPLRNYWRANKNSFGRKSNIDLSFISRLKDDNAWYASGSSGWRSQPSGRIEEGVIKAQEFVAMYLSGEIKLEKGETIKVVSHSQGGAHSVGFVQELMRYKNPDGSPLFKIEVMYYITPHQPNKFSHVEGVKGVQYSHPSDAVSSADPYMLPNGGSKFAKIKGITEFDGRDIMNDPEITGYENRPGMINSTGPNGNRGGHNGYDNDFIFTIPAGQQGYIEPGKPKPTLPGSKNLESKPAKKTTQ